MSKPLVERIVLALVAQRWLLLLVGALATVAAWFPAQRLGFDRSIENMFAPDDPVLPSFQRLKRTFGGDEIALAAYVDPALLTPAGLDRLQRLTKELAEVSGVASTFSLTTARGLLQTPLKNRLLDLSTGFTVGADRQTAGVICVLVPERDAPTPRSQTVDELRRRIEAHDPSSVLAGEPVMVVDGFRYLENDGRLLGAASTCLLMLTIIFCFRSLRWVLTPMAVVGATLLWTEAALVVSALRLSLVSSMLWAIVTVIGVATVVHLVIGFREGRQAGLTPRASLERSAGELAAPIFWSCATDAAGFAALMVSDVGPVHDFGLMMAIGSLLTLVAIALLVPGLSLWGRFDADPRRAWGEGGLDSGLRNMVDGINRWPRSLALVSAVASGACCVGSVWLDVETDFTRNFRRESPIVRSYEFVESHLGGAGVWDVMVPVPEPIPRDILARVRHLQDRLEREVRVTTADGATEPGLTKTLSAADALDMVPLARMLAGRSLEPALDRVSQIMPIVRSLYGHDPKQGNRLYLRIMLRAKERQPSAEKQHLINEARRISREEFPESEVTGFFVLLTRLIESMLRDQWVTFGVASAGIGLMVLAAFRSLRLALVALVPNAMPILVVTGLMGWLGVRINMGAAMIASVSMGLAVDSSIHYITAFRRQRNAGRTVDEALHAVHQSVGRAMIFSTLALVVGFSALALSRFVPTIYFGVLVSLTMFGGLLGNLVILPLLLKLTEPRER